MKIVFQSACRTIWLKHWYSEANVFEPGYEAGHFEPHYPVPATLANGWIARWFDPSFFQD